MKMQIAFRETSTVRHDHCVVIAGGIIEVGSGDARDYEETSLAFKFHFVDGTDHAVAISVVGDPRPLVDPDGWLQNDIEVGSLEGLLTCQMERAVPNEHLNADFILRETELPASVPGGRVFAFSGFLHVRPSQKFTFENLQWFEGVPGLPSQTMCFVGRSGIERRPENGRVDMVEGMRGRAMSALLHDPLWGFGEEAYGLPGTMRLSMYRKLKRYQDLFFEDGRTSDQQAEFDELRAEMRYAGLNNIETDARFRAYIGQMRERFPVHSAHRPMTASQMASREECVKLVVESILNDQLDQPAPGGP